MTTREPPSMFRCEPYGTKMRREACSLDWRRMNASRRTPGNGPGTEAMRAAEKSLSRSRCVGCEIGEVHARGERHPDAPDVAVVRHAHYSAPAGSKCGSCGRPSPTTKRGKAEPKWLRAWAHRCPHGDPCPGSSDLEAPPCCREPSAEPKPCAFFDPINREFVTPARPAEETPMAKKYSKTCTHCDLNFEAAHPRTLYCSDECKAAAKGTKPAKPKTPKPSAKVMPKPSGAQTLLEAVGYEVTELTATHAGIVLFVARAS